MQYNYNNIFLENRQMTNQSSLHWMSMIAALISVVWIFSLFHIISIFTVAFQIIAPVSILILLLPTILNKVMHLSDIVSVGSKGIRLLTGFILGCSLASAFLLLLS